MQTVGHVARGLLFILCLAFLSACGDVGKIALSSSALQILMNKNTLYVNQSMQLSGWGGTAPFTFSVASGAGTIDAATSVYTAASTPGLVTIEIKDSTGLITTQPITVLGAPQISYSPSSVTLVVGQAVPYQSIISAPLGGPISNCVANQTMPAGLSVDPNTCEVIGTATAEASGSYSVTASNPGGSSTASINIVVYGSYTVTASGTNVTFSPSTANVLYGTTQAFTVAANTGYTTSITAGGTCAAGNWNAAHTIYTTGAVTAACNVTFSAAINSYTVTASGTNVSVSPGTASVNYGSTQAITVTPSAGYTNSAAVGGTCAAGSWNVAGTVYTTGAVSSACSVVFSATLNSYTVTATGTHVTVNANAASTNYGSTQSFTVTPNTGYTNSPTVGGTCPAGSWNAANTIYTTGIVTGPCTVIFSATINSYTVTATGTNVTPSPASASVNYGSTQAITVTPGSGYTTSATVGGTCPAGTWNTANTIYTTGAITGACSVSFTSTLNSYTVTATGTNVTLNAGSASTNYGTTQSFTVTPNTGYTTSTTVGGTCPAGSWNTAHSIYTTGSVTGACTVTFSATINSYTVTASGTNATPSPASASVNYGSTQAITVTPSTGYTTSTTVGGTCPAGSWNTGNTIYTTGAITGACSVSFTSSINTYTVSASGTNVTLNASSASPNYGSTQSFTVTANTGYTTSTTVGGTCPAGTWNTGHTIYTTGAITAACTVTFSATINSYTVTATGTNATPSPASASVNYGSTQAITVTPSAGHTNSTTVGGTCPAGSWNTATTVYTTGAVTSACSVTFSTSLNSYSVTATGTNVTINVSSANVNYGSTQSFTVTATTGYTTSATVGGTCPAGSWSTSPAGTYTTGSITQACTVTFSATINSYTVTATGTNVTLNTGSASTNYGTTQSFTVTANTGYTNSTTVGGTCPAGSWNTAHSIYTTGAITAACTVLFSANANTYPVTVTGVTGLYLLTNGTTHALSSTPQTITATYGAPLTLTINQDTGYTTKLVTDTCSTTSAGSLNVTGAILGSANQPPSVYQMAYTTGNNITAGCAISFATSTYPVTVGGMPGTLGLSVNGWNDNTYSVTLNSAANVPMVVAITAPAGATPVASGCGTGTMTGSGTSFSYSTANITGPCSINFSIGTEAVTLVGVNGLSLAVGGQTVASGTTVQSATYNTQMLITITASPGYTPTATGCGGALTGSGTTYSYKTAVVTTPCTVTFGSSTFPVTIGSAGVTGLTLNPSGTTQAVTTGSTLTIGVTPSTGYTPVASGCGGTLTGSGTSYTYTTGAITGACTITFSTKIAVKVTGVTGLYLMVNGTPQALTAAQTVSVPTGAPATITVAQDSGYTTNLVSDSCSATKGTLSVAGAILGTSTQPPSIYQMSYTTAGNVTAPCTIALNTSTYPVTVTEFSGVAIGVGSQNYSYSMAPVTLNATASSAFVLNLTPSSGYTPTASGCGGTLAGSGTSYTFTTASVTAPCAISISATFGVTGTVPTGLTLSSSTIQTSANGTAMFTITQGSGYTVSQTVGGTCPAGVWGTTTASGSFDGPAVAVVSSGGAVAYAPASGYTAPTTPTYTTGKITAPCTVVFSALYQVSVNTNLAQAGYLQNVTFSPSATATLAPGATQSYTVTLSSGYKNLAAGGTCPYGSVTGSGSTYTYTTGSITAPCEVLLAGSNWTSSTMPAEGGYPNWAQAYLGSTSTVAYGNGKFVAVNLDAYVATSTDGINWTSTARVGYGNLYSVAFGNGIFVATGGGAPGITSTDGVNWGGSVPYSLTHITFGNGRFVGIDEYSSRTATSTDGVNWTISSVPTGTSSSGSNEWQYWYSITYGNGKFVAIGQAFQPNNVTVGTSAVSTDGVHWTYSAMSQTVQLNPVAVTYGLGKFVAVTSYSGEVATSTDGVNWTLATMAGGWNSVTFSGSTFMATNSGGYDYSVSTSTNGTTWTPTVIPTPPGDSIQWSSVFYAAGKFIALFQGTFMAVLTGP
jgi:hypothetical protein